MAKPKRLFKPVSTAPKNDAEHALRFAQRFKHVAVVCLQFVAVQAQQTLPIDVLGNRRRFVERRPALLIRHLEEEQKRQLLDVVAIRQPVIAKDVAVVPEFLDQLVGLLGHAENTTGKAYSSALNGVVPHLRDLRIGG